MRFQAALLVFLATLLSSGSATAVGQDDTREAELAQANKLLNETYSDLLQRLPVAARPKLKAAQRAWVQMRDLDCQWAFIDRRDCLIDRTENRTRELAETAFQASSGKYESIREGKR